jgi:hypothetical protein
MSAAFLTSQTSYSVDEIPSASTDHFQGPQGCYEIRRLAVGSSGIIGSFYDAKEDCFRLKSSPKVLFKPITHIEKTSAPEIQSVIVYDGNLIDIIDMDKELYLSIRSGTTPSSGVPLLMQSPSMINE